MKFSLQVGITGGIGSGKSTVAAIFASLGIPVYDADSRAKSVMTTDAMLVGQIKKEFGDLTYDSHGGLNRKYLSAQVFGFPERLEKLNGLVHPRVTEDYKHWLALQVEKPYVLKEAALLFETGSASQLDKIIVVTAPQLLRVKRVMMRDHRSETEIMSIMQRQWAGAQSIEQADYVIENDEVSPLIPQVLKLHREFLTARGSNP
jgi:dephospho-CoA kinase